MAKTIDLNCDLGEGIGNEASLMPFLSSCNIACGGHAGDVKTMSHAVELALKYDVKVGAHPSFPDRENFGRKVLNMSNKELFSSIKNQISVLNQILIKRNASLKHVKPHGALYNLAVKNDAIAEVIVEAVRSFNQNWALFVPFQSKIEKKAIEYGVPVKFEVFADRNYNDDLSLVSRLNDNALIESVSEMFEHVYEMVVNDKVITINGVGKTIKADTVCVHSDSKNMEHNIEVLVQKLKCQNIVIK